MPISDWTVEVVGLVAQSAKVSHVSVLFTRIADQRIVKDVVTLSGSDQFEAKARESILDIERNDIRAVLLKPGPIDVSVPPIDPPSPPTQGEIEKAAYFKALSTLQGYRLALKNDDPVLVAQEGVVKTLFKPEYHG